MDGRAADQIAAGVVKVGMRLDDLPTPCLVLDRRILSRNLKRMSDTVRRHGVTLRPHLKTAKSAEVARMATEGEAGGITVSTLAEAEYFADRGFRDILIAAALPPGKLDRAAALIARGAAVTLVTDDVSAATAIARHHGAFRVLIEIDSGDRRAGVEPASASVLELGRALQGKLAGVMTHAGHSYGCRTVQCIRDIAEDERSAVFTAARRLRTAGMPCEVVSVGSTPTMTHAERLDGVTEARPGVYMFQDLFQAEIGSCRTDDIALTVLTSVIGRNLDDNRIVLDAGALALSKDRSTQATAHDFGYGRVWDIDGNPSLGSCIVERAYQEHGVAAAVEQLPMEMLRVGAKVRVAPNHACITAAAHDRYYVVDGGREVVAEWDRVNGW
jgi:D-serine deaminase-like pyridoxal phosphate-dependent protein